MLYEAMAGIGYPPREVDELDVWQAARLLGADDNTPSIIGSRGVVLKSDQDEGPGAADPTKPWASTKAMVQMDAEQRGGSTLDGTDW